MTPNALEILIHCHVSSAIHPREDAPSVQESINMLLGHRLIVGRDDGYRTTPKGRAHIKQIMDLQYPTEQWVDASGKIIDVDNQSDDDVDWQTDVVKILQDAIQNIDIKDILLSHRIKIYDAEIEESFLDSIQAAAMTDILASKHNTEYGRKFIRSCLEDSINRHK